MGIVKVKAKVSNPSNRAFSKEIEMLADIGAIYSLIPSSILEELNIEPIGKRKFRLADGRIKEFDVGEAYIEVQNVGVTSLIVFGDEDSNPLLGLTSLELLGFEVDVINKRLKGLELFLL
ncbi:hypothetical protein HRbin06_00359 [archaeon HR06]|nr:hypothetical protein HRbin06_00359 [archaeon HR06]